MKAELKVTLVQQPSNADGLAGLAASICSGNGNLMNALDHAMDGNHLSVVEHVGFTFYVSGVSRALLAQLTRHRIASFSVQSQRYVTMDGFDFIIPPEISKLGEDAEQEFIGQMQTINSWYCSWAERLMANGRKKTQANEDARFVLPNAAATCLLVTMNARELLHFFELRCCTHAQWEIRELAWAMLKECQAAAPKVFAKAGPGCVRGVCPEGKRSCKMMWKDKTDL